MSLAQLAEARLTMNLPTFPGSSLVEQLVNGRNAALAALRKFVPDFAFDVTAADAAMRSIDAWADRNNAALSEAMAKPDADLPATIQTELGSDKAQAFILATFTTAASGLGPWHAGEIDRLVATPGSKIGPNWAAEDAARRLQVFGSIVRMDEDGRLAHIFVPPNGAGGLGIAPIVWVIVIAAVLITAAILTFVFMNNRMQANNALMAELCRDAQKNGDAATVQSCIEATRDLQQTPLETVPNQIIKTALILGAIYIVVRYGLPYLSKGSGPSRTTALVR